MTSESISAAVTPAATAAQLRSGEEQHHQRRAEELLQKMHQRGLPDAPAGGEIAREHARERDEGQPEGQDAQAHHRPRVAYPEEAYGLCEGVEYRAARRAEEKAVRRAAAHRPAYAAAPAQAYLLSHQPRRRKAYPAYRKGRGQQLHAHHELIEPDARRAYAPGQPGLEHHADAAHQYRRAREQRRIHNKPLFHKRTAPRLYS